MEYGKINMLTHTGSNTLINKNERFITKVKMTPNLLFPLKFHHEIKSCHAWIFWFQMMIGCDMHFGHLFFCVELFVNNTKEFVSDFPIGHLFFGLNYLSII